MSGILANLARFARLGQLLGLTSEPDPEAIAAARAELRDKSHTGHATLGTPRLEDFSGDYDSDVQAVIPVHMERHEAAPLMFDVDGHKLAQFCDAYGVEIESIGAVEGASIPVLWSDGTPVPSWTQLVDDEGGDD